MVDLKNDINDKLYNDGSKLVYPNVNFYSKYGKRMFDVIFGSIAFLLTLPINLVLAIVTLFDVGLPIIFKQERIGLNNEVFTIYKFRNMTNEVDENGKLLPASERVTKIGKIVRKLSLDEMLQFGLIVTGKMSFIGPRPLVKSYLPQYTERHRMRHLVRPGLECPPHNDEVSTFNWEERFENDIWYVENLSFKTDLLMIVQMFKLVFNRKNNSVRSDVGKSRGDYFIENRR